MTQQERGSDPSTKVGESSQPKRLRYEQIGIDPNPASEHNRLRSTTYLYKPMALLCGLLGFVDDEIEETTKHILKSLDGNPIYPTPPVTAANLHSTLTAFTDAILAQAQGSTGYSEWSKLFGHISLCYLVIFPIY